MGNSQSVNNVVHFAKKCFQFYKAVKKEQLKQQQQQQQQSYHTHAAAAGATTTTNTNHYNQHDNHYDIPYHHVQDDHDDPEYTRLRALAHKEAEERNRCYEESQAAYHSGDGARAKELSNQGKHHDNLMRKYNKQAADLVFYQKNHGRPPTEIDLHGLFVKEASEKVQEALQRCQSMGLDHLVIIVGKGLHSPDHVAKLKPAIKDLVMQYQVAVEPNKPNPGCLYVEFGKGTSNLSWLDQALDAAARDNCIIM